MDERKQRGVVALAVSAALFMAGSASAFQSGPAVRTADAPALPTAEELADLPRAEALEVRTWQDIPGAGRFAASDEPETAFTVAKRPRNGTVAVDGSAFTYTPAPGFTGMDRFTYTCTELDGGQVRTSLPGTVTVFVGRQTVPYADMDGHGAAQAAQELAEAGVFTGEKIGERYYFGPEEAVSREEFLALTMEALGRRAADAAATGFADDAVIPAWVRGYAAAGVREGIVRGIDVGDGAVFLGDAPVTWSQAAAILSRSLSLEDVDLDEWYGLRERLSSWAAQEVGNLEAAGVLPAGSFGSLTVEEALTRADAAELLTAARRVLESGQASGWLSRLAEAVRSGA